MTAFRKLTDAERHYVGIISEVYIPSEIKERKREILGKLDYLQNFSRIDRYIKNLREQGHACEHKYYGGNSSDDGDVDVGHDEWFVDGIRFQDTEHYIKFNKASEEYSCLREELAGIREKIKELAGEAPESFKYYSFKRRAGSDMLPLIVKDMMSNPVVKAGHTRHIILKDIVAMGMATEKEKEEYFNFKEA